DAPRAPVSTAAAIAALRPRDRHVARRAAELDLPAIDCPGEVVGLEAPPAVDALELPAVEHQVGHATRHVDRDRDPAGPDDAAVARAAVERNPRRPVRSTEVELEVVRAATDVDGRH